MRFSVINLGCRSNYFDGEFIAQRLSQRGYLRSEEGVDVYIINTCSVTSQAERSSRQQIYKVKRENPKALVVVTGCYAQTSPGDLASLKEVDLVVGNSHKGRLVEVLEEYLHLRGRKVFVDSIFKQDHLESFDLVVFFEKARPFVKVQEGCNNFCTFCVIPYARGKLRSVPTQKVAQQVKLLAEGGFKEIVLTGTQLTQYGRDLGTDLCELMKELLRIDGIEMFRLSSLYPTEIDKGLFELMVGEDRIAPHFHLSLQSGSDRILKLMDRGYTAEDYRRLVEKLVERRPKVAVGTDLIAGFPTETEDDFKETCWLVQSLPFAYLHVFSYSDRPYTKAYNMLPKVGEKVKKERVAKLRALDQEKREEFRKRMEGQTLRAIIIEKGRAITENYIQLEGDIFEEVGGVRLVRL